MPRSGTSLMMHMLDAGGVPALSDGRRPADLHNPHGYFEDERTRRLAQDSSWIEEARGKAIKIIYRLLPHLPPRLEYDILFMERDLHEIYDSQKTMLEAKSDPSAGQDRDRMVHALGRDLDMVREWLAKQASIRCISVPYAKMVREPERWAVQVAQFLGRDLDVGAMAAVVDPALYRHRIAR